MNRLLITATLLVTIISCKKEDPNKTYCYECDFSTINSPGSSPGTYQDAGCLTPGQWRTVEFTDQFGTRTLEKDRYCRKR